MIRDNALAVSGLLVRTLGGPPVKPYELTVGFIPVEPDEGDDLYRRSLYTLWKRNSPAPTMVTFDAPKRDVCTVKRETTASPLQPLIILNGPQFVEASRVLAEKLIREHPGDEEAQIEMAFRLLTSRLPEKEEVSLLGNFLDRQLNEFRSDPAGAETIIGGWPSPAFRGCRSNRSRRQDGGYQYLDEFQRKYFSTMNTPLCTGHEKRDWFESPRLPQ